MGKRLLYLCAVLLLLSGPAARAESKNVADYPLRVHILSRSETTFYRNSIEDEAKGEGRANLFENADVHGLDFTYACDHQIKPSFGDETYAAKWKKPGQQLTLLLPVFGKRNEYFTCTLITEVQTYIYGSASNGRLVALPAEKLKAWMVAHDYDPVHGKYQPLQQKSAQPPIPPASPAAAPAPR